MLAGGEGHCGNRFGGHFGCLGMGGRWGEGARAGGGIVGGEAGWLGLESGLGMWDEEGEMWDGKGG